MHGKMLQCASFNEIIHELYMFINVMQLVDNSKVPMNGIQDPCQNCAQVVLSGPYDLCSRAARKSLSFLIEIPCWAPRISLFQSTRLILPSIFLRTQLYAAFSALKIIEGGTQSTCMSTSFSSVILPSRPTFYWWSWSDDLYVVTRTVTSSDSLSPIFFFSSQLTCSFIIQVGEHFLHR